MQSTEESSTSPPPSDLQTVSDVEESNVEESDSDAEESEPGDSEHLLVTIRNIINNRPPYVRGTLPVTEKDLLLFYERGSEARRVNFATASDVELEQLAQACDPATFGRNKEDVLDESYRKAGKLDSDKFAATFDVAASGLLQCIGNFIPEDLDGDLQEESLTYHIKDQGGRTVRDVPLGGKAEAEGTDEEEEDEWEMMQVFWVTALNNHTLRRFAFATYGNDAEIEYRYGRLCLVVGVKAYEERT